MTNTEKTGLMGHSIGGAAAVQLGRERDDITAVIDIDGTMLGEERLEIYCHRVSSEITEIVRFVKSLQGQLTGIMEGTQYEIPVSDVLYLEGVDNKVFIYCEKQIYETRQKLYELEEALKEKHFLRVSKSVLLNLMKVSSIKPSLNSRFMAVLQNGEQIVVSRKYVPELKKALKGGKI